MLHEQQCLTEVIFKLIANIKRFFEPDWLFLGIIYVGDSKRQTVGLSQSQSFVLEGLLVNYFIAGLDRLIILDVLLSV